MSDRALHWFPFYPSDWLSSPDVIHMTYGQRGRFIHLLAIAWGNGVKEPHLEAESLKAASALVKKQWKRRDDGCYYNAKLTDVWRESQVRHEKAVARARKGGFGKAKSASSRNKQAPSTAQALLEHKHTSMTMGIESSKDSSSSSAAVVVADAPTAAELPRETGPRVGGMSKLLDIMAGMGLKPRSAP